MSIQDEQPSCHEVAASYAQNMSEQETFGDRLRKRMKERNVTMPELAKGLKPRKNGVLEGDLGRAAVYGWLNGNGFPNVVQLGEICRKLDISADYLVFGGIRQASPQMATAMRAIKELSVEEQNAVFALINGPAIADEHVGKFLSAPPPHELDSGFGGLEPTAPPYQGNRIKPHHPATKELGKDKKENE